MDDAKHALAVSGITAGVAILGLQYELLLAGFAGGLVTLSYIENSSFRRCVWVLFVSMLTAAYSAPVCGAWLVSAYPFAEKASPIRFCAFMIGALSQWAVPGVVGLLKRHLPKQETPE